MRPVVLAAQFLKVLLEESAHLDDTVSHALDFTQPLLVQLSIVHDSGGDTGTVDGRVGVERADEDLELRVYSLLLLGRFADEREGTDTLTVETPRILVAGPDDVISEFDVPCSWQSSGTEQCCDLPEQSA